MVKGTKILNPADKARKEARKKELKKNKKQRQQVRSALIEKRDPEQIIADLEKLDELEYDITSYQSVNDILYKDKRKRLKEAWSKILEYYSKEDPERHAKLKQLEAGYERKHRKLASQFEAIRAAQEVKLEDIFLPPEGNSVIDDIADDDPLLESLSFIVVGQDNQIQPPGCPPGLPPDLRQIVESLKCNLISMDELNSQPLAYLQQQQQQQLAAPYIPSNNKQPHGQFRDKSRKFKKELNRLEEKSQWPQELNSQQANPPKGNVPNNIVSSKTVIESKPVLFKPKVTKFVPSSVRSKLSKNKQSS